MKGQQTIGIKVSIHYLAPEYNYIYVVPFADCHIGEAKDGVHLFREDVFDEYIDFVDRVPNAYAVVLGDIVALPGRYGRVTEIWHQAMTPQEQLNYAVKKFEPIKDKIIGVVGGTHEGRVYASVGLEVMSEFCSRLGLNHKHIYGRDGILLKIFFGRFHPKRERKNVFYVYLIHGWGGARKTGGQVNKAEELGNLIHADLYLIAHEHTFFTSKNEYIMPTIGGKLRTHQKTFVGVGSFAEYSHFLQAVGRRYPHIGAPIIKLTMRRIEGRIRKDVNVYSSLEE